MPPLLSNSGPLPVKAALRSELLRRRTALSADIQAEHSAAVQRRVLESPQWKTARAVALYMNARNEIATDCLLEQAWSDGKQVFLPRCLPSSAGEGLMVFVPVTGYDQLVKGAFGLLEPASELPALPRERPQTLPELVLVPAVGLSPAGARIGYGKGFYDRLLSLPGWNEVPRLALIHSLQLADFPADPLDVPLHGYVTEKELVWL